MPKGKKILVAVLNWGLGHASRCIPLVRELQAQGADVFLASDGRALDLLKQEFPDLPAFELPAYHVRYHSHNMAWNMATQAHKILRAIYLEKKAVEKLVLAHGIQGIISDNRFGCRSREVPSVFITHQINLLVPFSPLEKIARAINRHFINAFDECWVPDVAGEPNLSGKLSHGLGKTAFRLRYIGCPSRMELFETAKKYDAIAVLSGPEPQRTAFENAILGQAKKLPQRFLIVQGRTERKERFFIGENIELVSCLSSRELNQAILASRFYIGRCGYSTVMDLAKLGMPALLVPTPGQTEQEYLAGKLAGEGMFLAQGQGELDIAPALRGHFAGQVPDIFGSNAEAIKALKDLLHHTPPSLEPGV